VRHSENLREHYAMTLREWGRNLERNWGHAVAEVGERRARAWRLYMTVSRIAFDTNRLQIHQFLGVRLDSEGRSGMPLRPEWEGPQEADPDGEGGRKVHSDDGVTRTIHARSRRVPVT
jgi:hypothetical protein